MKSSTVATTLALSLAAVGLGLTATSVVAGMKVAARPAPMPATLAVVDIERVFNNLKEKVVRESELNAQGQGFQVELERQKKAIDALEENLKVMPEGPEKQKARLEFVRKRATLQVEAELAQAQIEKARADTFRELYGKINSAAGRFAAQQGYSIVLSSDDKVQVQSDLPAADVTRIISLRRVLWVDPKQDITTDLIQLMDNEFQAGGSKPAPSGGGTPATPAPGGGTAPAGGAAKTNGNPAGKSGN